MTYTAEKSTVRTSAQERQLITIEFAPKIHPDETEYSYQQPLFVFGEQVTRITGTSPAPLTICGMELVESKTNSGQLLNQPYWKYLVNDGQQKKWFSESALTRLSTRRLFLKDTAAHMGMKLHTHMRSGLFSM